MAGKPVLHYFNGRGRMECIRWLLAAGGASGAPGGDGRLMFQQVPMVEIDGMTLVQSRAILNYIATKYDLYGKDAKERALIDMYTEGILDLSEMMLQVVISLPEQREAKISLVKEKTKNRYLPAYEKGPNGEAQHVDGEEQAQLKKCSKLQQDKGLDRYYGITNTRETE
ncbi:hypothetical protein U0070_001797 [Myodes glareolus]|uniref:glutathione transferase n=1 Tax=Myodes glareolus TaxID=447135 RepID=A0AAW0IQP7_MYOGA